MKPLLSISSKFRNKINTVLCDIDDTITTEGRLSARAYLSLERLQLGGFKVIPITGRPAGWCDHIARMWPVDGVVGENGALWYRYDHITKKMHQSYAMSDEDRTTSRQKLITLQTKILKTVPNAGIASDQAFRIADLAIDFCEDVDPLSETEIQHIVDLFEQAGATAKVSSIHVNGWFGEWDKLSMTRMMMRDCFNIDIDASKDTIVFAGDSPNDAPMFGFFPFSIGMANVKDFKGQLSSEPAYITQQRAGDGFAELADFLLSNKST
jgi:HAD superfamily hydrolase (TIGR01484 family)